MKGISFRLQCLERTAEEVLESVVKVTFQVCTDIQGKDTVKQQQRVSYTVRGT